MMVDLERRIEALEDRRAIVDLLTTYTLRVDEYDIDAVAALFTEDCTTDYGPGRGGPVNGRDNVRARIAKGQAEFRRTHHQHGQVLITFEGGDGGGSLTTAHVVSYLTAWHELWNGAIETVRLRYLDVVVKADGSWKLARRAVVAAGVEGFAGVEWEWVVRTEPDQRPGAAERSTSQRHVSPRSAGGSTRHVP